MKKTFLQRVLWLMIPLLTIFTTNVWGATYNLYSGAITEGDYIIVYSGKAMKNSITSSRWDYESVSVSQNKITNPTNEAKIVWHITASGTYWTIYSADASKYAVGTGSKNTGGMDANPSSNGEKWTVSGTSTYEFVNKRNKDAKVNANLRGNGNYGFACYGTGTGGALSLYKKVASCTVVPTVGSDLTSVTATVNSITATVPITAIGGCNITENGLVYSTSNTTPTVGGTNCTKVTVTACGSTAANKTVELTGLNCGTTYYVRGYATNEAGTSYTNVKNQATSACPKYTVTLEDDGTELTQATAGASVTLPSRSGCTGYTFAGWTKTWTSTQTEWTTTAPTIIPAGSYTPEGNENLYPVYTKTEESGGGGEPTAYSVGDVGDYVLAALNKNDSKWYAIPTSPTLTSGKIDGSEITVNESAGGVNYVTTSNASGYTWTIAKSGSFYTISDGTSYLYHATGGASGTNLEYGNSTDYIWSITNDNGLVFAGVVASTSTTNTRGLLYQYNTSSNPQVLNKFGGYALSNKDGTAYSRVQLLPIGGGSTTSYISVPNCCTKYDVTSSGGGTVGGGTFSASPTSACEGATVTLSASICSGYTQGVWTVTKAGGGTVTVTSDQFTMPAENVTVSLATTAKVDHFKDAMHETIGYTGDGYAVSGCNQTVPNLNPTTPGSECEGEHYKFVGWVDEAYVASDGTLLTGYSIVAGGTTSWNATGTTYYAIWAKEL